MLYFGKRKNSDVWGFDVSEDMFDSCIEYSEEKYNSLMVEANKKGKFVGADKNGKPVLVDPPKPSEEIVNQEHIRDLEFYLESTDWYIIRQLDTGEEMPADIKKKRQEAREEISRLREE